MKLLFDMNLSPGLVELMGRSGWESIHWSILLTVLKQYKRYLESGALISVEETRSRVRILPLRRE
jgi:predicted nuclease of predicted toxin-antitoxin system